MKEYAQLHTHSIFSIRDSIAKIDEIVARAAQLNIKNYALTDHGKFNN